MRAALAALLLAGAAALVGPAQAAEQIERFDAAIGVRADGDLDVLETLRVRAEGAQIVHGIFRDLPTIRRTASGLVERHAYTLLSVRRDGHDEPYRTERIEGGLRIYVGDPQQHVPPGLHDYELHYRSAGQLRHFPDFDEIYWNVTGNGWSFPILAASARVQLPPGAGIRQSAFYTGRLGERGAGARIVSQGDGRIAFETTAPLRPREGLTVAVGFDTGHVPVPGALARALRHLRDNAAFYLALLAPLAMALYYGWAWRRVGRDPPRGIVVPRFVPPGGLSPAATAYVFYRGRPETLRGASRALIAALVSLAAKGRIRMREAGRAVELSRVAPAADAGADALPPGERALEDGLLGARDTITIDRSAGTTVAAAARAMHKALARETDGRYFRHNLGWWLGGVALAAAALVLLFNAGNLSPFQQFATIFAAIASVLGAHLAVDGMRRVSGDMPGAWSWPGYPLLAIGAALLVAVLAGGVLPGAIAPALARSLGADRASAALVAAVMVMALLAIAFRALLYAPTPEGAALADEIAGFRDYLSVAEADRMNLPGRPEFDTRLFERYLPYAIALGVEKPWSDALEHYLERTATPDAYRPGFYGGGAFGPARGIASAAGVASTLGASIAHAMPSGSGSGGSGSSGGGGGGGGGGGW